MTAVLVDLMQAAAVRLERGEPASDVIVAPDVYAAALSACGRSESLLEDVVLTLESLDGERYEIRVHKGPRSDPPFRFVEVTS